MQCLPTDLKLISSSRRMQAEVAALNRLASDLVALARNLLSPLSPILIVVAHPVSIDRIC